MVMCSRQAGALEPAFELVAVDQRFAVASGEQLTGVALGLAQREQVGRLIIYGPGRLHRPDGRATSAAQVLLTRRTKYR